MSTLANYCKNNHLEIISFKQKSIFYLFFLSQKYKEKRQECKEKEEYREIFILSN